MASVYLNGVDLEAEFPGCYVAALPDVLSRAQMVQGGASIPGVAGEYPAGPASVPARTFAIGLTMEDASATAVRQMLQSIRSLCGSHLIQVRVADGLELAIDANYIGGRAAGDPVGELVNTGLSAELQFRAPHPYWRSRYALTYLVTSTKTRLPLGNAPSAYLLEVFPATSTSVVDPVVTLYDHTGTAVRTSTFTGLTIPADDVLTVVTWQDQMSIEYSDAGVVSQNDTLLPSGQLFPAVLDPHRYGNPYLQHWPMMAVTATSGMPIARITYPEHYV